MGRRGPKPKAPEVEAAQGFPSRRKGRTKAQLGAKQEPKTTCNTDGVDSRNVPEPPAWLLGKRAREIWREKFADPSTRIWFKNSDHAFIARHCQRRAEWERLAKRDPKPTYTTVGSSGRIIRKNPEYTLMLDLHRDLRADEQLLAGNPVARVDMEKRTIGQGKNNPPGAGDGEKAASGQHHGPLGALKAAATQRPN